MDANELFVPGRLCLFGEHSDWAGGHRVRAPQLPPGRCLVSGTDQGLRARFRRHPDAFVVQSVLPDGTPRGPLRVPASPDALAEVARRDAFFGYAAGVAAEVLRRFDAAGGLELHVLEADLPMGSGLSSSAAVCVLVARAFGRAWELGLSIRDEMQLAYAGERLAGSACGRMDQICAYGRRPVMLTFDGDGLEIEPVAPGGEIALLIVDLRRGKDTRRILSDLNACFPDTPGRLAEGVREALGPRNAALLGRARALLHEGDARGLGELMSEAQALFDALVAPACPELAAPRLHEVLESGAARDLAWGGKGVGSQGDGCAQLVARGPEERDALARRLEREFAVACLPLGLAPDAADRAGQSSA